MLKIHVEVYASVRAYDDGEPAVLDYIMDHDNPQQRRALGMRCRLAFESGQVVLTYPEASHG